MITNPDEIAAKYKFWQLRVLIFATFGYAMFYFKCAKIYSVVHAAHRALTWDINKERPRADS